MSVSPRRVEHLYVDWGLTTEDGPGVAVGGTNAPRNLQTLCRDCNRAKGPRI